MSRSLVRRNVGLAGSNTTNIILLLVAAAFIYFMVRQSRVAQYNAETLTIQRDERGRIAGLTVNRSVH